MRAPRRRAEQNANITYTDRKLSLKFPSIMFLKHQKFTKVKQKTKQNKEEGKIVKLCPQESSEEIWGFLIKQRIHKKQEEKKKLRVQRTKN